MGRKAMERHGEESERLVGVSTSCWSSLLRRVARCESAAKLGCKKSTRFGGGNVKDHGNKPIKLDSLLKSSFGRYVTPASRSHFTISNHRLRWAVGGMRFTAPLPVENGKSGGVRPFVQGGTHTHTHSTSKMTHRKHFADQFFLRPTPSHGPTGHFVGWRPGCAECSSHDGNDGVLRWRQRTRFLRVGRAVLFTWHVPSYAI